MSDSAASNEFGPQNIAAQWWLGGCSVVPIRADRSKAPVFSWKQYQQEKPPFNDVKFWFEERYLRAGVAVICGNVSGNLEMLELEGRAHTPEILEQISAACGDAGVGNLWDELLNTGYTEITPSGGLHLLYRVAGHPVPSNTKIASRPATEEEYNQNEKAIRTQQPEWHATRVLAETRGEGGYVIVAPTSGLSHPSGRPWVTRTGIPGKFMTINWDERSLIHLAIRTVLHQPTPHEQFNDDRLPVPVPMRPAGAPLSVAEDFNARASWHDAWFTDQGWQVHHREADELFWTRPGKDLEDGHSATTGFRQGEQDCLYVWSTSTSLPAERPLTKFMVYSHYMHGGNMSAAARALQKAGYGPAPIAPVMFGEFDLGQGWHGPDEVDIADLPEIRPYHMDALLEDQQGGIVLTDSAYALRMRDLYRDHLRYNNSENAWYVWQPGIGTWMPDNYNSVDTAVHNVAQATYNWLKAYLEQNAGSPSEKSIAKLVQESKAGLNHNRLTAIVNRFRTMEPIAVVSEDFDSTIDLINLRNGTLNLTTGQLKAHDPHDLVTLSCNANYDPGAACNDFEQYIIEVLPDEELRAYVQRAMGYSLLGRPVERAMFMLHGPSGTGKSVFTDVMTHIFGSYGITAPSTTFKQKKQDGGTFDLHRLRGKRFVTTSEMPEGAQLDEELVKRITGGDVIPSRGLYEKYVDWAPKCVIWIGTNFLPRLNGDDNAIWRRVRTIPMITEIGLNGKAEIKGLNKRLQQESDGIFNWVLAGLDAYRRTGLAEPDVVLEDIRAYRTDTDSVASWLSIGMEEGLWELDPTFRTPIMNAYNSYTTNCQENGINQLGKQRFAKRLPSVNGTLHIQTVSGQRVIVGLRQTSPR